MDPLEFFPPEISLQCILDILLLRSHGYSHTILELASVSRRWQDFIFSVPSLWVEINVESPINDLLAIVSVFLTFSGALPLKIVIWVDAEESWKDVCPLLLPHAARISTLVYAGEMPMNLPTTHRVLVLSKVISSLGHPPNLKVIDFGNVILPGDLQLNSMVLQPETRIASNVHMGPLYTGTDKDHLTHLTSLTTFYAVEEMIPMMRWLPKLTEIRFLGGDREYHGLQTPHQNTLLPRLKLVLSNSNYSGSLDRVIQDSASQLYSLSVFTQSTVELRTLLSALRSLSKLQELHLEIYLSSGRSEVGPYPKYRDPIPSLHTLSVRVDPYLGKLAFKVDTLSKLFTSLAAIYPRAKKVTLGGPTSMLKLARGYLQGLLSVQSLRLEDKASEAPEIRLHLPSLHVLWVRCPGPELQEYLEVPNLLHLVIRQVESSAQLGELSFLQLRRLEVQTSPSSEMSALTLNPTKYPALCELKMDLAGPLVLWELTSFPNLTSIHLSSVGMMPIHANRLFITLIYEPTICPSLQHIQLADFVEWDLLFLMLQRRNFENMGVKPINELIIPFVPPEFRTHLHLLLERKESTIPEDLDMSLVTTREIICDAMM